MTNPFNKDHLIQLTNNLYRLTLLFPKKEPLRYKMRELANDILATLLLNQDENISRPLQSRYIANINVTKQDLVTLLEVIDGFFEVAKSQNWVPVVEILRIQEEYSRMKAEIKKISKKPVVEREREVEAVEVKPRQPQPRFVLGKVSFNERQEKILSFLKENGRAQVWELKKIFPEVTKRTLRRDFEFLLKQGKIERIGERNETFYQLRSLAP